MPFAGVHACTALREISVVRHSHATLFITSADPTCILRGRCRWCRLLQGVPLLQCYGTNRAIHVGTVVVALQVRTPALLRLMCRSVSCQPSIPS
jgi:hypothetical protein